MVKQRRTLLIVCVRFLVVLCLLWFTIFYLVVDDHNHSTLSFRINVAMNSASTRFWSGFWKRQTRRRQKKKHILSARTNESIGKPMSLRFSFYRNSKYNVSLSSISCHQKYDWICLIYSKRKKKQKFYIWIILRLR